MYNVMMATVLGSDVTQPVFFSNTTGSYIWLFSPSRPLLLTIIVGVFYKLTNKIIIKIKLQIITLLHVSTPPCHPQGARIHYLAKLHKYINCSPY